VRLLGYIRVSRVAGREGASFISPELQRKQIEAYASAHGHEVIGWGEDLDESGGKVSRPQFDLALAALERGEADGLIVARLDRFMRSLPDALDVIERIEAAGAELVSVSDNFDSSTPMGRFARDLVLRLGQLERERVTEGWSSTTATAFERGAYIGPTPTGYRRREDGTLELDEAVAPVIHEVFRRRADGESWASLGRYMTAAGIETAFGNPKWTGGSVKRLVANGVYTGTMRHGDRVRRNAVPAIVTRAEFEAAQRQPVPKPASGEGLLLTGLARCASCRYRMKGHKRGSYACEHDHAAGDCPHPTSIRAPGLDEFVLREFWNRLGVATIAEPVEATNEVDAALADMESAEHELDAYMSTALVDVVGAEIFRRGAEARQRSLDKARERFAEAQRSVGAAKLNLSLDLRKAWESDELNLAERRTILAGAIDAVVVWPSSGRGKRDPVETRARIAWRGEAPEDLPGPGRVAYEIAPWPEPRPSRDAKPHLRVART
jgi:DNA invertase Pin-like site-specific DNA recombinase